MTKEKKLGTKGGTGRFMPCPVNLFAHTEGLGAVGTEVRWSCKKTKSGGRKVSYYIHCGLCNAQVFYNTWNEAWGFTLPQAESMGMTLVKLDSARKSELLKELGLERMPPPGPPGPPGPPPGLPGPGFPPGFPPPGVPYRQRMGPPPKKPKK